MLRSIYPGAAENTDYFVEVNGQPIFVHNHQDYRTEGSRMGYAQFTADGSVKIRVTYLKEPLKTCQISPLAYEIPYTMEGNTVTFSLDQPRYLILFFNRGDTPCFLCDGLILFGEPAEEKPPILGASGVINILDYGVDATGQRVDTDKINQAILDASKLPGGGVVYFPSGGVYQTGSIDMQSKVHLYLAEGALLKGSSNPAAYAQAANAKGFMKGALILFKNVENSGILGRGTIDANGYPELFSAKDRPSIFTLAFDQCKNICLEGILLKNSMLWTIHVIDSDNFTSRNVKILNRKSDYWEDIYDIDISRHVLIENGFALSMDDMWAFKGTVPDQRKPMHDIKIRKFVAYGFDSGLAIGYNNRETGFAYIRDVVFEDVHIVSALVDWGFHITYEKGVGEAWKEIEPQAPLENWRFKDISFEDGGTLLIAGGDALIRNFSFEEVRFYNTAAGYKGILRGNHVENMTFEGVVSNGVHITDLEAFAQIGSGIDLCCPIEMLPSEEDAYLFDLQAAILDYLKGDHAEALLKLNRSISAHGDCGRTYFYRGVLNILTAEGKRSDGEAWEDTLQMARRDMEQAEMLGYYMAREFKMKFCISLNLIHDIKAFQSDLLRRVLFLDHGVPAYAQENYIHKIMAPNPKI